MVDAKEADVGAVHRERDEHQLDVDRGPVLPQSLCDPVCATDRHGLPTDLEPLVAVRLAEDEVLDGPTDRLFGRVAEELGRGRVPVGHPLVGVHDDHRRGTDRDERLQVLALPLYLGEQACVLDRDADVGGDRREKPGVGFAEPALLLDALDADDPDRRVSGKDRNAQEGPHRGTHRHASCSSNCGDRLSSSGARDSRMREVSPSPYAIDGSSRRCPLSW